MLLQGRNFLYPLYFGYLINYLCRALEVLKPLTSDSETPQKLSTSGSTASDLDDADDSLINSDIKSPISIVHEMALKRKLTVSFEVQSEKGPPHMKVYTTLCKVGTIVVCSCIIFILRIHFN